MSTITGPRRPGLRFDWFRVLSTIIGLIAFALLIIAAAVIVPPLASLTAEPGYMISAIVFLVVLAAVAIAVTANRPPSPTNRNS